MTLLKLQRQNAGKIAASVVLLAYLAINAFILGGDGFVFSLNQALVPFLAIAAVGSLWLLLPRLSYGSQNRLLWSGFLAGLALWTIAELIWAVASIRGQEVPYPSWADAFWLVGYLPMYYALRARDRTLPQRLTLRQNLTVWGVTLAMAFWTVFFIFVPVIQQSDPTALIESALNLLYPLVDLVLLVIVLRILFAYQQGQYGKAWTWISLGITAISISDLVFTYASATEVFYPDGQANLISTLGVDTLYNSGYLFLLAGFYQLHRLFATHQPAADLQVQLPLVPNTHLLVFTRGDDTLIDVSANFGRVFPSESPKGKTIAEVLGLASETAERLLHELKSENRLGERPVPMQTRSGAQPVLVSGVVVLNPQKEYSGVMLLLRLLTDDYSLDTLLSKDEARMVRSLLEKMGTAQKRETEIKTLLARYYSTHLSALYNRMVTEGGAILGDAYVTEMQSIVHRHGWPLSLDHGAPVDVQVLSVSEAQESLSHLLETARTYVARIIDQMTADTIAQDIDARFGDAALRNMQFARTIESRT